MQAGHSLAEALRQRAIELAQSRGTEFDPAILQLHLWAAKVALLVFAQNPEHGQVYENDILYYRGFPGSQSLVEEYLKFKDDQACEAQTQ